MERANNLHGMPEKIPIDKTGANTAAIESAKANACVDIVEQDHRAVKMDCPRGSTTSAAQQLCSLAV